MLDGTLSQPEAFKHSKGWKVPQGFPVSDRRRDEAGVLLRHHISNTFGNCGSGSAAAPTTIATIAIRVWLMQRLLRIWPAIHSSTSVSNHWPSSAPNSRYRCPATARPCAEAPARPDAD